MKKSIVFVAAVFSASVLASDQFSLSRECKKEIEGWALESEMHLIAKNGERLASSLHAKSYLNYYPNRPTALVGVTLEDPVDGRFVRYTAKVSKADAQRCLIPLRRSEDSACRYSRHEGPDSLNEIAGLRFISGRDIKANEKLSSLEDAQIRAFLVPEDSADAAVSTRELIESTDDKELSTGTLELSDGRTLDYYGAYGGDNPFGIFFVSGTTLIAGSNSDGSICIK